MTIIAENVGLASMFGVSMLIAFGVQLFFYFLGVLLLRYAYNESIPKMNEQYKKIELREAIHLALFFWIVGMFAMPLIRQ